MNTIAKTRSLVANTIAHGITSCDPEISRGCFVYWGTEYLAQVCVAPNGTGLPSVDPVHMPHYLVPIMVCGGVLYEWHRVG
jgi:hypothetical protein